MIRIFMAVCLLGSILAAYQEETQKTEEKTDTEKSRTGSASKSTDSAAKSTSSKEPAKKNGTSTKQSSASPPPPLSPEAQAATDAVTALDSAIRLTTRDDKHSNEEATAKLSELRGQLNTGDPKAIAREAAKWTAQVYQVSPVPVQSEKLPGEQPTRPARALDPIWVLMLVSLTSPLICIGGFWFGSRISDHNLRKQLREAGLL